MWGDHMVPNKKLITSILTLTICFTQITALASSQNQLENKINNNKNQIGNLEKQQSDIKNEKKVLEGSLEDILSQIKSKGDEVSSVEQKLSSLNLTIKEKEISLVTLNKEIKVIEDDIALKQKEILKKEEEHKKASELLGKRLKSLYMSNQTDIFIDFLFESKSIVDLVYRFNTIGIVYKHDSDLMKTIKETQNQLQQYKDDLEKQKLSIDNKKIQVETEVAKLDESKTQLVSEKNLYAQKLSELESMESAKESAIASLSEKDKELQNKIGDLTAYNKDLENQLKQILNDLNNPGKDPGNSSENNTNPSTSGFLRPVGGPITSPFGPRIHPIYGDQGFHRGVDYGAPSGTPIKASKAGTVVLSQYSSSFGNYVIINHGNGVQTLYAHASSLNCSVGQQVQQGQVVAYVGSTGWSTGPHLHFEIRINGEAVNPQNYIPN